ncbi:MAG: hypothetical protein KDA75_14010 [Planctomycetaceae bacterium]|nr:hypothetical protein [Planctomycetaceae bacterium]
MRSTWIIPLTFLATLLPVAVHAGWPLTAEGPRRGTYEWYEMHACDPIGQRQRVKFGKSWPVAPRPIGEPAPLVHRFHHNHFWPYPYDEMDYEGVQQFKFQQMAGGWQEATTLYDYHFDNDTNDLNSAGRDQLYWIMSSTPMEFRTAYVQASRTDPSISNVRIASVQSEASRFLGGQQMLPVVLRVAQPYGTPAEQVNKVFEYRRDNLSPPPEIGGGGGGGGGGDGG